MPSCLFFLLVSFVQGGEAIRVEVKPTSNRYVQPNTSQQENVRPTSAHPNFSAGDAGVISAERAPIPYALVGGLGILVGTQPSSVRHSQILVPNFSGHNFTSRTINALTAVGIECDHGVVPHRIEWICFYFLASFILVLVFYGMYSLVRVGGTSWLSRRRRCRARRRETGKQEEVLLQTSRQTLRQKSEQSILDRELRWVDDDEKRKICSIREKLASVLVGCPEDMTHDISIARFLRGHGGHADRAADLLGKSLSYRTRLLQDSPIVRDFRTAIARDTQVNMKKLPYAEQFLRFLPVRPTVGGTVDDLPIMFSAPKIINVDEFVKAHDSDKLQVFLRASIEQRSIVLYNLSIQQRRMVKFVELRDFSDAPIATLLTKGRPLFTKLHEFVKEVHDYYPEIMHEALIFNAPAAIVGVISMVTSIMGERMKSKIKLMPTGQAHCELLNRLSARALFSWISDAHGDSPMQSWKIAAGSEGYLVRWLTKGQKLLWVVQVQESSTSVLHCFIPQEPHAERRPVGVTKVPAYVESPHRGCLIAQSDGVFWLCVSNSGAWLATKTVSVSMEQE